MPDRWQEVPLHGQPYSQNPFKTKQESPADSAGDSDEGIDAIGEGGTKGV